MAARDTNERAVVVHTLAHALDALDAAAEAGRPVTLISAPGAAATLGVGGYLGIVAAARELRPAVPARAVLDCGSDLGWALAALRMGVDAVRVDAGDEAFGRVRAIAVACGGAAERSRPEALDPLDLPDPAAACRAWLAASRNDRSEEQETAP